MTGVLQDFDANLKSFGMLLVSPSASHTCRLASDFKACLEYIRLDIIITATYCCLENKMKIREL